LTPDSNRASTAVELSLFASRVAAVCEEMGALLGRAAFSPNIRDRRDYSCALFDAEGQLLGQATHIPVHLGSMAHAMGGLAASRSWRDGDMLILNDPFRGGTHLPDITLIAPVYCERRLIGFCANRAHHADIGAEAPGSMPVSTSLAEEGLRIPPTLLLRDGKIIEDRLEQLLGQLRDGAAARGDFSAQIAANRLGVKRLAGLARELDSDRGARFFEQRCRMLQDYAERVSRATLADIPDGTYRFEDRMDDDGLGAESPAPRGVPIRVALRIVGGEAEVDFEGTSPQVAGNLNCPLAVTAAAVFYVFRCLMPPQLPACAGALRPFRLTAPEGCLVNAREPAAVTAGNVETSTRIVDAVCGALARAVPKRIPAAAQGTMNNLAMGRPGAGGWDYYETIAGGHGASAAHAGLSARHSHMTNTLNTPVEVIERHYPLRVERYQLRRGSGGGGRHRGGDGVNRVYRFLEDAELSIISERRRFRPWGLEGGAPGAPGENRLDGQAMPAKCQQSVKAGQVLEIQTPGGGGYGKAS
jgi:N-methylhydantoinase B